MKRSTERCLLYEMFNSTVAVAPKVGYTVCMLLSYDDVMSQKAESGREVYGPRPVRTTTTQRKSLNFRVEPELLKKLEGLAEIENGVALSEDPKSGHISINAELHYILEEFVRGYERLYGAIPDPDDRAALARHVKARTK